MPFQGVSSLTWTAPPERSFFVSGLGLRVFADCEAILRKPNEIPRPETENLDALFHSDAADAAAEEAGNQIASSRNNNVLHNARRLMRALCPKLLNLGRTNRARIDDRWRILVCSRKIWPAAAVGAPNVESGVNRRQALWRTLTDSERDLCQRFG
jgi:hypothetical protein